MPLTQHLDPSLSCFIFNKAEKNEEWKILFPSWRPLTISWMTSFLRSKDSSVMAELWASENLYAFSLNCFSKWCPDVLKNPTAGIASQLCCVLNSASQWLLPLLVLRPLLSHKEDAQDEEQRCQRNWLGGMSHHEGMGGCRGRWYLLCCWRIACTSLQRVGITWVRSRWVLASLECRYLLASVYNLGKKASASYCLRAGALWSIHTPCSVWRL